MTQEEMFSDLALEQQYENMIKELGMKKEMLEEIAQWVIDNRYAKSEFDKISDFEMYHIIIEKVSKWQQERSYSKEDVLQILPRVTDNYDLKMDIRMTPEMQNEWFSRLKKKQETRDELEGFEDFKLEKAAIKYSPENGRVQMAFVVGAKSHEAKEYWQKGMYSEEEVKSMLYNCCESLEQDNRRFFNTDLLVEEIIKQFKKK